MISRDLLLQSVKGPTFVFSEHTSESTTYCTLLHCYYSTELSASAHNLTLYVNVIGLSTTFLTQILQSSLKELKKHMPFLTDNALWDIKYALPDTTVPRIW